MLPSRSVEAGRCDRCSLVNRSASGLTITQKPGSCINCSARSRSAANASDAGKIVENSTTKLTTPCAKDDRKAPSSPQPEASAGSVFAKDQGQHYALQRSAAVKSSLDAEEVRASRALARGFGFRRRPLRPKLGSQQPEDRTAYPHRPAPRPAPPRSALPCGKCGWWSWR